jgi:hypothetical protein
MQVWDRTGTKLFERKFIKPVTKWCICFEYFVFKTEEGDVDSKYFHVLNLKTMAMTQIEGFLEDEADDYNHFAINGEKLYAASEDTIKIATVKLHTKKTERPLIRKIRDCDISTISMVYNEQEWKKQQEGRIPKVQKIHGLAVPEKGLTELTDGKKLRDFVYVFVEITQRGQNLISMNKLRLIEEKMYPYKDKSRPHEFYEFEEHREYVDRKVDVSKLRNIDDSNRVEDY